MHHIAHPILLACNAQNIQNKLLENQAFLAIVFSTLISGQIHPTFVMAEIAVCRLAVAKLWEIAEKPATARRLFIFNEKLTPSGNQPPATACIIMAGQADFLIQFLCQVAH